jgi:hypothetical protein
MEEWKDIPGYEGLYQASTLGQIRTCNGKTTSSARFKTRVWKQRIIKQKCAKSIKGRYDCRVELWKNGSHKTWLVSRLVALTWCDGYTSGMTVNHIDGDPLNNKANNLEWISLEDNIKHGFANGLYSTQKACVLINESGEKKTFLSQSEASRNIGRSNSYIATKLKKHDLFATSIDGQKYMIEGN